jgi:hypothetical protein
MKKSMMVFALGICCATLSAAVPLFPYILGHPVSGELAEVEGEVRTALVDAGFEVVGGYSPYDGARVIVVTHAELLGVAARSDMGGFAAALRVAVTENAGKIEVSYSNPAWVANVCRLEGDLEPVATALETALGREREFGSKKGKEPKKLRKYHYMAFMPYFDDTVELATHPTHEQAVEAVEAGLAAGNAGASKVYRVDVPGREEVLFGVALAEGEGADEAVMAVTDTGELKHTAHLPYELLVSGKDVYALHGKFRIAQSFPDLGMGTFMKISGAPNAIHKALKAAAE